MAWNEPNKNDSDRLNNRSRKPDTPPDLDEVLKKLQQKLKSLFGNARTSKLQNSPKMPESTLSISFLISVICILALIIWFLTGFFIVAPAEKAVMLRWGKYLTTQEPGLHWMPVLIDTKYIINVQQVKTFPYQAEMLTQDENIVSVDLVVQYRITNLENYLFRVQNPNESLQQATASALRQVIGQTTLDEVLTSGREKVRQQTQNALEKILQRYQTGLMITDINMQPVKPPEEVTAAFDDAIKAREDEQRFKNQAVTYANRFVPIATGQASRLIAEANAYQQQVVLAAEGAAAQFLAVLPQYRLSPEVTRQRMYLDTLQAVLTQSPKIFTDTPQANQLMYLPLDQLLKKPGKQNLISDDNPTFTAPLKNNLTNMTENDASQNFNKLNYPNNRPSYSIETGG